MGASTSCDSCGGASGRDDHVKLAESQQPAGTSGPSRDAASASGTSDDEWPDDAARRDQNDSEGGTGTNDKQTPTAPIAPIPQQWLERYRKQFDAMDPSRSGFIEGRQFLNMLRRMYVPTREEVEHVLAVFDKDHDGGLNIKEFKNALASVNERFRERAHRRHVRELFRHHDANHDGVLSGAELFAVCQDMLTIPRHSSQVALELFDTDGDKRVSFDEYAYTMWNAGAQLRAIWETFHVPEHTRRSLMAGRGEGEAEEENGDDEDGNLQDDDGDNSRVLSDLPNSYYTKYLTAAHYPHKEHERGSYYRRHHNNDSKSFFHW